MKKVLAFDFGASSGRAMLAEFDGKTFAMEEIHRFSNDPVYVNGVLYWDILRLFHEIKQGILKAVQCGGFDCIGIDTWGVDFGLIDKDGNLLSNPICYRDAYTNDVMEKVFEKIDRDTLYNKTGIQLINFNTVFQLVAYALKKTDTFKRADKMLLIPDLFNYFLTGEKKAEYTEASTAQLIDPTTKDWSYEICDILDIPRDLLPPIIDSGEVYGELTDEICEELGCKKVPVISVASHDTASAIVATPNTGKDFIYISCGTWSLFGTECDEAIINDKTRAYNFSNEGGFGKKITLLKNIMGLWLIQQSRKHWVSIGEDVSYGDLEQAALKEKPFACFVDPDDASFVAPGNMPKRVQEYCARTGQYVPQTKGEIMRCIYESLALKYRLTYDAIKDVTEKGYDSIHMIGGGTKDNFLCQLTANATDTTVYAGPIEATVTGNIAACLVALGEVRDLAHAREIVKASTTPIVYESDRSLDWEEAYSRFKAILGV